MGSDLTRRSFLGAAGIAAAGATGMVAAEDQNPPQASAIKILGIATSYRKGKTTAAAVQICLDAAKEVNPERITVELIELADLKIPGGPAAGVALGPDEKDDFPALASKLTDPQVAGIVIGSPVYFGAMSGLCKTFIDRWMVFRKKFALSNKVAGVVAVGGGRNGGQEQTIRAIQTCLFGQEMIVVGDGQPTAHWGGTVWNKEKDDITTDDVGLASVRNLGRRMAELALRLSKT